MEFKHALLSSLVAFSTSTLAAYDTKSYVVELSANVPSELTVQLVDDSGNELLTSQTQPLVETSFFRWFALGANGLVDGYKLASNDEGITYRVSRSLSPLSSNVDLSTKLIINRLIVSTDNGCTEYFGGPIANNLVNENYSNSEAVIYSSIKNNDTLCSTDVAFVFFPNAPAGEYAATLTIDVVPDL